MSKHLHDTKLKSSGLVSFAEEISRLPNIDSVMWLLVITLMLICNEKEQAGLQEIQNIQFEEKKTNRKFYVRALVCAERDKEKWNKGKGDLRARCHPTNSITCEKA